MSALATFHPLVQRWFRERFAAPTGAQVRGWPSIAAGGDTLIAAPTGSGKALAAFLVCLDRLIREGLAGRLTETARVVYVSPLKALSNDIQRNLNGPLSELQAMGAEEGLDLPPIRTVVRTGDTPPSVRQAMLKHPPHLLVTTPESLYLLLTAQKSREMMRTVDTVIVDEIHALARDKRGSHLALSLERLEHVADKRPVRIGLSATQKPMDAIARFLVGTQGSCAVVDTGHQRDLDMSVEVPPGELSAVCSNEQWDDIYTQLKDMIDQHRSTLVFVNTRKLAERVAFHLCHHLGEDAVASHHGSLAKERRLDAEERLKRGELKAIVATASLELGIDIGHIDLVCQVGSPRSIATFLQRVGRSGHAVGATPKGRLFPLTRDELMESLALIRSVREGTLDAIEIPTAPLDILAQQIVAETAAQEWDEDALFSLFRRAAPYADLHRKDFDEVVSMLARGYARNGFGPTYIHHDAVHKKLRARKGARLTALTSGGAIPEQPLYRVVNADDGTFVGTVDEDFAIERPAGTVFLLGNTSWMILHTRGTTMTVRDAQGAPPTIPFWMGEAPGRTVELSAAVSRLREDIVSRLDMSGNNSEALAGVTGAQDAFDLDPKAYAPAREWLAAAIGDHPWANLQAVHYLAVQQAALGVVPTQRQVVFERFFDDVGGLQLVIHAPFGMRINRGWGLALRKSFCRSFDFELQAVADNEGIVLSVGANQSFPTEDLFHFLSPDNVTPLLEQAMLQAPFFRARWQWNANRALAVPRMQGGKKLAPAIQRMRGEDLLTAVFPASTQCFEHITGDIDLPDHPLVNETMHDCLYEAVDLPRLIAVLGEVKDGAVSLTARETREPSPFCYERLNAAPYAFLDDAPLEERRTRALSQRRTLPFEDLRNLTQLDGEAVAQVQADAWPLVRDADELHDALLSLVVLPQEDGGPWGPLFEALVREGRAAAFRIHEEWFWFAAERLPVVRAVYERAEVRPVLALPERLQQDWTPEDAGRLLLKGQLEARGLLTAQQLAGLLALPVDRVDLLLPALEAEGGVVRGHFTGNDDTQWCARRLLMRMHRLTVEGLRRRIKPVSVHDYLHYLVRHHRLLPRQRRDGKNGLLDTLAQLQGFETAAGEWEGALLPARLHHYSPGWLDELCHTGVATWGRLHPPVRDEGAPVRGGMTRVAPLSLVLREDLAWVLPGNRSEEALPLSAGAKKVFGVLEQYGARFAHELEAGTGLLKTELNDALGELARLGLAHADGFAAVRPYISAQTKKLLDRPRGHRRRGGAAPTYTQGGRWALFPGMVPTVVDDERTEHWAWLLLDRYGVVFRDLLARESAAPPWRDLAPHYRRMEARGEIRGGRFVTGVSGEQFALPGAVEELRAVRDDPATDDEWVVLSAADPLNLVGVLWEGGRIPAGRHVRLALKGGRHVATLEGAVVTFHEPQSPELSLRMEQALRHGKVLPLPPPGAKTDDAEVLRKLTLT